MRGSIRRSLPLLLPGLLAVGAALPAQASGAVSASVGAASAPSYPRPGGAEFGQPNGRPSAAHPVATAVSALAPTANHGEPRLAARNSTIAVKAAPAAIGAADLE